MGLDWSRKRVLVTGAGGFLGSHVMEHLQTRNCAALFGVRSRDYDLTREAEAQRLFTEHPADVVLHLAGLVGGIGANLARPAEFFYQNLMLGTLLLHYAWNSGAETFVAAGAGCGYPEHAPMPLVESSFWDGPPQPQSAPYSLAKRLLQVQSESYGRQYGFCSVITIPGNIYGPHDNFDLEASHVIPGLVRKFVEAADDRLPGVTVWGSGRPTRDFVYAGDVAAGILAAAETYRQPALVNLSSGVETSIRAVVETLAAITGFSGEIVWDASRPDGQARRVFDINKARRELGYEPRTNLRAGLESTVNWYRANRRSARNTVAATA